MAKDKKVEVVEKVEKKVEVKKAEPKAEPMPGYGIVIEGK
jgi:hypothetical protein